MTGIDWIIIGLYCFGLLAVGAIFARSNKNASDMFVAGRSSPWWLSGVSAYMTMFTAGTFVVWGGLTYEYMVELCVTSLKSMKDQIDPRGYCTCALFKSFKGASSLPV